MKLFVVNSFVILILLVFLQLYEETNAEALATYPFKNFFPKQNHYFDDDEWNLHSFYDDDDYDDDDGVHGSYSDESDEDKHEYNTHKHSPPIQLPIPPNVPPSRQQTPPPRPLEKPSPVGPYWSLVGYRPSETQISRPPTFLSYYSYSQPGYPTVSQDVSERTLIVGSGNTVQKLMDVKSNINIPITVGKNR